MSEPQPTHRDGARNGADIEGAYRACSDIVAREAKNFAYAFKLLDGSRRRAIAAAYAFSRRLDDIADGDAEPERKRESLRREREACVRALRRGGPAPSGDRVLLALRDTQRRFRIPPRYFLEHVAGVARDVDQTRYRTFADLHEYCYGVAGVVGLISLAIFGHAEGAHVREHAVDLGLAMQLTNIIRDVGEDMERGRVYLPREDMDRFGVNENDLAAPRASIPLQRLLAFEAGRARRYFRRGLRLLPALEPRARACPAALAAIYGRLLDRMEENGFPVVGGARQRLPGREKATIALRVLGETLLSG